MHETLRSSFKLQKENAEWQRITSDIANNTFFSIYAKFNYSNDSFTPTSCKIKIQNYRGSITYGISGIDPELKFIYDKTEGIQDFVFLITIKLKPLIVCTEMESNLKIKHYNNTSKKINQLPNHFSTNHLMFVHLEYEDFHEGKLDPKKNDANIFSFIDENYYVRDGDKIRTKRYLDTPYNSNTSNEKDIEIPSFTKLLDPHQSIMGIVRSTSPGSANRDNIPDNTNEYYISSKPCRDTYVRFFNSNE